MTASHRRARPASILSTFAAAILSVGLIGGPMAQAAQAECQGVNLLDTMPEAERRALIAATDAVPYPRGHLWRATRGDSVVHLVGTYHLDDPRHDGTMARITPLLDAAETILVEAGPLEEAALMADLARDPSLMVMTEGPTLREALSDEEWTLLASAMRERGMPPFMVSKMRPWYVSMLLALPACDLSSLAGGKGGLDGMVIDHAQARGTPIVALESHETIFRIFEGMPLAEQLGMIRSSLALEPYAADYAVTLADAYFDGESRLIWELTRQKTLALPGQDPAQVEADFARMEQVLMTDRSRAWIPVIEAAAAKGPAVAAFGALHLPGETGVLRLLEEAGFTLERLPM
jgi:uncharacterized protein YbaP (TraB family)